MPSAAAASRPLTVLPAVWNELKALSHPLLDPLETTYSPHPIELQSQLGFRPGDVILQVNNARVTSAEDAATIFGRLRGQGAVQIYFERDGGLRVQSFYWRG